MANFVVAGIREMGRKRQRRKARKAIAAEQKKLHAAEVELGRASWHEAGHFDDLREEYQIILGAEEQQTKLQAAITRSEGRIKELHQERLQLTDLRKSTVETLDKERTEHSTLRSHASDQVKRKRDEMAGVDKRTKDLDKEEAELLRKYADIQAANPQPQDMEKEQARLTRRRAAIPNERADLVQDRLRLSEELSPLQEDLAVAEARLEVLDKKSREVKGEFEQKERSLNEMIQAEEAEIARARRESHQLDKQKDEPFSTVGRRLAERKAATLADSPLLAGVMAHRKTILEHEQRVENLWIETAQMERGQLRNFYLVVLLLLLLVVGVAAAASWQYVEQNLTREAEEPRLEAPLPTGAEANEEPA